jgi:hypothetical protein
MYLVEHIDNIMPLETGGGDNPKKKIEAKRRLNGLLLRFYDHTLTRKHQQKLSPADETVFEDYKYANHHPVQKFVKNLSTIWSNILPLSRKQAL